MAPPGSAYYAGATAAPKRNPYLPGDDAVNEPDNLDGVPSTQPSSLARSRGGGATAVSPGAGTNPTGAYSPDPSSFGTSGAGNPQPNIIRDVYSPELQVAANQLKDAYAAPRPGMFRQVAGALLSRRNPAIGGLVSGETQRARTIEPLQQQYGMIANQIGTQRAIDTADITNQLHVAQAGLAGQRAATLANPPEKPNPEEQAVQTYIKQGMNPAQAYAKVQQDKQDVKPDKVTPPVKGELTDIDVGGVNHKVLVDPTTGKTIQDLGQSKLPKAGDPEVADMNKQLKQLQISEAQKKLDAAGKPTAQEQNRADLAKNLNENIDQLEDIINRRPELFGPVAGRITEGKIYSGFGTDDPDIGALANIKHQMGMAQISAHGMRSAQGVEGAANSLANFHNDPKAIKGSLASARKSVSTFTQDAETARAAGATPSKGATATTPAGGFKPF